MRATSLLPVALLAMGCSHAPARASRAPAPPAIPLAVTLDDLPFVGETAPGRSRAESIDRIVAAAGGAPLTAFVTCHRAQEDGEDLSRWAGSGVPLENHSHSHRALDELGLEPWRADVERCQAQIERATGRAPRFFRYPFLRTGADRELRDAGLRVLDELSLRRAPVTVDTSDWALGPLYLGALARSDHERASAIAEAYVTHVRASARRSVRLATALGHPGAPQILLLHANALAADHLGALLEALRADGFSFVTLEEAMRHPLYAREDHYAGTIGMSWLYRVEHGGAPRWAWDAAQHHALQVRFGGEDERERFDLDVELSIRRIAPRTWVVTHREPWAANSLVAAMPDGTVVMVDTPYTDEATQALLDWTGARFGRAPILAINTHFHPDRVGGNRALRDAGARIAGSTHTARLVRESALSMRAQMAEWLRDRPEIAARFARYDPLPPTETFDPSEGATYRFGGEEVRVLFPGAGHSPDNVVVHFPARGLVFGGCLIMAGERIGNTSDADLEAWPAAVLRVRALAPTLVVPGHGERTDAGLLHHTLALLAAPGGADQAAQ